MIRLDYSGNAGNFDFRAHAFDGLDMTDLSWRISDHFPIWAEFGIPREGSAG